FGARLTQCVGQSAQGQIRPLGDKKDGTFAEPDFASAVGPDPGNGTQQGALARTAGPGNEHRLTAGRGKAYPAQKRRPIGPINVEFMKGHPKPAPAKHDLARCSHPLMDSLQTLLETA